MTTRKPRAPKGWRIVTSGKVLNGDRKFIPISTDPGEILGCWSLIESGDFDDGYPVEAFICIARRIHRPARKVGKCKVKDQGRAR